MSEDWDDPDTSAPVTVGLLLMLCYNVMPMLF